MLQHTVAFLEFDAVIHVQLSLLKLLRNIQLASVTNKYAIYLCIHGVIYIIAFSACPQCFDAVGWAAGRASGL